MTTDVNMIRDALDAIEVRWGGDDNESQLDALFWGVYNNMIGWTGSPYDPSGNPYIRVLILATDCMFHTAGDARKFAPGHTWLDHDVHDNNIRCLTYDYPPVEHVRRVFQSYRIMPLFLVRVRDVPRNYYCYLKWIFGGVD